MSKDKYEYQPPVIQPPPISDIVKTLPAAKSLKDLPETVAKTFKDRGLTKIPTVGEALNLWPHGLRLAFGYKDIIVETVLEEHWGKVGLQRYEAEVMHRKAEKLRNGYIIQYGIAKDTPDKDVMRMSDVIHMTNHCQNVCTGEECCMSDNKHHMPSFSVDKSGKVTFSNEYAFCVKRDSYVRRMNRERALAAANVPRIYRDVSREDFVVDSGNIEVLSRVFNDICERYSRFENGLYIYGDVGTGKTMLLSFIASSIAQENPKSKMSFVTMTGMVQLMKTGISATRRYDRDGHRLEGAKTIDELCREYSSVDYLFIDDFLTGQITEFVSDQLFNIINERYENMRPTFFTSNYTPQEYMLMLAATKGSESPCDVIQMNLRRIFSRLSQTVTFYKLGGADRRKTK